MDGLPEELTNDDLVYFKCACITSTYDERSFSRYKNILTDNRRPLNVENIFFKKKKALVVKFNKFTRMKPVDY